MKKYLRKISAILSIILTMSVTSSIAYADTKDSPILFDDLPDETVIMYVGGEEVTIGDLDSDNSIIIEGTKYFFTPNEEIDELILNDNSNDNLNDGMPNYVIDPGYDGSGPQALEILPSGKTNAFVQRRLNTTGYSQQTDTYYLDSNTGAKFAYNLVSGSTMSIIANGCLSIALGAAKFYVGAIYSAATMFSALANKSVGDQIISYTSRGQKVRITSCKSPYGTLKGVSQWSSNAIEITCINNKTTSEYIYNKVFY
ncbi:hypothetical protein [Clostridium sp. Marseille-Q7071]